MPATSKNDPRTPPYIANNQNQTETRYCEADGLGTVTSLSNTSGALAQTYTFDSFGKQTASSGSLTNPIQSTARKASFRLPEDFF
jgi:hypothetical protein